MVTLDYAVIPRGWDTYVSLTETIKTDMKFISDNMQEDNGVNNPCTQKQLNLEAVAPNLSCASRINFFKSILEF